MDRMLSTTNCTKISSTTTTSKWTKFSQQQMHQKFLNNSKMDQFLSTISAPNSFNNKQLIQLSFLTHGLAIYFFQDFISLSNLLLCGSLGKRKKHQSMQDQFFKQAALYVITYWDWCFFLLKIFQFCNIKTLGNFQKKIRISAIYTQKQKFKKFPKVFVIKTRQFVKKKDTLAGLNSSSMFPIYPTNFVALLCMTKLLQHSYLHIIKLCCFSLHKITRGVTHCGLAIYIKKYL